MMNDLRIKLSRKVRDRHDEIFLNYWEALNKCNGLSYLRKKDSVPYSCQFSNVQFYCFINLTQSLQNTNIIY